MQRVILRDSSGTRSHYLNRQILSCACPIGREGRRKPAFDVFEPCGTYLLAWFVKSHRADLPGVELSSTTQSFSCCRHEDPTRPSYSS